MADPQPHPPIDDSYFNPYAAPKSDLAPVAVQPGEGLWRDGNLLVMSKQASLPDRCVRCNAPAGGFRLRRNLTWHHPAYYIILLFNLLIYVIVALCVRKTAKIDIGLCPDHRSKRIRAIVIGWLGALGGIALFSVGAANSGPAASPDLAWLILVGLVVFLVGLFWGVFGSQTVVPVKIDDRLVWLKKVGSEYLAELPTSPYPR
jgi:hypothetical protein